MAQNQYVTFRLTGNKKPVNWQLGIKGMMVPNREKGGALKRVQYIPGSESIFKDDHKGDEKPQSIWFQDGLLKVHINDKPLLTILYNHKQYNKEFEKVDPDREADKELAKMELQERALAKANVSDDMELRASAVVLMGHGALTMSDKVIRMKVKKMAFEQPQKLLDELNSAEYRGKYIAALSVLKEVVLINESRTAVTWKDGNIIVSVAAGQDPITRLGTFLSGDSEQSVTTLQALGEEIKRKYVRKVEVTGEDEIKAIMEDKEGKKDVDLPEQPPFADLANDPNDEVVDDSPEMSLEEVQQLYTEFVGTVPNNKKNDIDWLKSKIEEQRNA